MTTTQKVMRVLSWLPLAVLGLTQLLLWSDMGQTQQNIRLLLRQDGELEFAIEDLQSPGLKTPLKSVTTKMLRIVNDQGSVVAVVTDRDSGGGVLVLADAKQQARIGLFARPDGGQIKLNDGDGSRPKVVMDIDADGDGHLRVYTESGQGFAEVAGSGVGAAIVMGNTKNGAGISIAYDDDQAAEPVVAIFGQDSEEVARMGTRNGVGHVKVTDPRRRRENVLQPR